MHSLIGPYAWRVFANKPRTFKFGEQFLDVFYVGERAFSSVFTIASSEQSRVGEFSRPLPASRVCRTLFLKLLDFFCSQFLCDRNLELVRWWMSTSIKSELFSFLCVNQGQISTKKLPSVVTQNSATIVCFFYFYLSHFVVNSFMVSGLLTSVELFNS